MAMMINRSPKSTTESSKPGSVAQAFSSVQELNRGLGRGLVHAPFIGPMAALQFQADTEDCIHKVLLQEPKTFGKSGQHGLLVAFSYAERQLRFLLC